MAYVESPRPVCIPTVALLEVVREQSAVQQAANGLRGWFLRSVFALLQQLRVSVRAVLPIMLQGL